MKNNYRTGYKINDDDDYQRSLSKQWLIILYKRLILIWDEWLNELVEWI